MTEKGKLRVLAAIGLFCLVAAVVGWGVSTVGAQSDQPLGRYQVAAPDLMLDTATGKLTDSRGTVLEQPVDPAGKDAGRYTAAGYTTVITRAVGVNVIQVPYVQQELVKGYAIGDSKTGRIVRQRIYASQPVAATDLTPK